MMMNVSIVLEASSPPEVMISPQVFVPSEDDIEGDENDKFRHQFLIIKH